VRGIESITVSHYSQTARIAILAPAYSDRRRYGARRFGEVPVGRMVQPVAGTRIRGTTMTQKSVSDAAPAEIGAWAP
jgi:hypothetical protein